MRTSLLLVVVASLALGGVSTLPGQVLARNSIDPRLTRGTVIRATPGDSTAPLIEGRVDSIFGDTVAVRMWPDSLAFLRLSEMSSLVARLHGHNATQVGRTFFTLGAVAGASMYVSWCVRNIELCRRLDYESKDCDEDDDEDDDGGISLPPIFTLMTFGTGAVLGGLAYALVPTRWEQIKLPLRVGIAPASRGVLVYASLSFR